MTVTSRAEAEGRVVKQPFEDRLEQASYDFLRNAIANRGDSQRAELAVALGKEFQDGDWDRV